jgi:hypothetical protein
LNCACQAVLAAARRGQDNITFDDFKKKREEMGTNRKGGGEKRDKKAENN